MLEQIKVVKHFFQFNSCKMCDRVLLSYVGLDFRSYRQSIATDYPAIDSRCMMLRHEQTYGCPQRLIIVEPAWI
jgi:hypothetical protein